VAPAGPQHRAPAGGVRRHRPAVHDHRVHGERGPEPVPPPAAAQGRPRPHGGAAGGGGGGGGGGECGQVGQECVCPAMCVCACVSVCVSLEYKAMAAITLRNLKIVSNVL